MESNVTGPFLLVMLWSRLPMLARSAYPPLSIPRLWAWGLGPGGALVRGMPWPGMGDRRYLGKAHSSSDHANPFTSNGRMSSFAESKTPWLPKGATDEHGVPRHKNIICFFFGWQNWRGRGGQIVFGALLQAGSGHLQVSGPVAVGGFFSGCSGCRGWVRPGWMGCSDVLAQTASRGHD